ncbi:MAG: alanine racemase, partial [Erysipelotrichia bacterium]|nr:alanine racemase [Erysipelotrichia bacterium]
VEEVTKHHCEGLKVHLKVDTGMNRIGFRDNDELNQAKRLLIDNNCALEGIFTHFACAENSREMTDRQYMKFKDAVLALDYPFKWIHCDNSAATLFFKDPLSNACRVGISIYGISDVPCNLKPTLALYTKIIMAKTVKAGESIGYGATYTASSDEMIATVPIGYADGLVRANQGRKVWADGIYAEIVGRVCMDQCMLKMPEYRPEGTTVEIFGPHIPIENMAEELNTITYEIICLISGRVTRRYIRSGRAVGEENERMRSSEVSSK